MTITFHAKKRMNYRKITIKEILDCLFLGDKQQEGNTIKHTYKNIVVITDLEKTKIITTYYKSKINHLIKKLARKYKISFRQAITVYKQQLA